MLETLPLLALATLLSEDLACIAAGVLIARGDLSPTAGVLACAAGIFAGDCGLWALGRFGGAVLSRKTAAAPPDTGAGWRRRWPLALGQAAAVGHRWLDRHAGALIFASRFTPGTRLPLYVSAGLVRLPFRRFGLWTGVAVAIWTPAVVLASARAGQAGTQAGGGPVWLVVAASLAVVVVTRSAVWLEHSRRSSIVPAIRRYRRWEFWPPWVFYAPVVAWVAWLAMRHGGLGTLTACNPGIQDGGLVGESKAAILDRLPADATIPHRRIVAGGNVDAVQATLQEMRDAGWGVPVVLKPDVGQRGAGVWLIRSVEQLTAYLARATGTILLQPFHPGPYEAGIFYYRFPHEPRGRIFSITDKQFPVVVGDGVSSLRQLIEAHPRYRLQADLFLARHATTLETVPAHDERRLLGFAGNHAQGALFRDGAHLWTPELEARIDAIARQFPGFFIGRFDVRYGNVDAFKAGRDLAIVELNGATSESTNIYDPDRTLADAYRVLFRQWALVFAIGAMNRARGEQSTPARTIAHLILRHLTSPPVPSPALFTNARAFVHHAPAAPARAGAAGFDTARRAALKASPGRALSEGPRFGPKSKPIGRTIRVVHE